MKSPPTPLELPGCALPTSTCLPFSAEGPVGVDAAGPVGMLPCPLRYGFALLPLTPACAWRRLRGPVGGVAPIREVDDAPEVAEEAVTAGADAGREFSNARGARGGALPDIDEQGGRGDGRVKRTWSRWWSWVKQHRPCFAPLWRRLQPAQLCLKLQGDHSSLSCKFAHGIRTWG